MPIRRPLLSLVLASTALGAPMSALAWNPVREQPYVWLPEDMPIRYVVQETCEDSVPQDYCVEMIAAQYADWKAVPCTYLDFEYAGPYEGRPPGTFHTHDLGDPHNHWVFEDPSDTQEPGVLASNIVQRFGLAFQLYGLNFAPADTGDTSFNDNVNFGTQEQFLAGDCEGRHNMRAIAAQQTGGFLGLGHSCEPGQICDWRPTLMDWRSGGCATMVTPQDDDARGLQALYSPSASFSCSHRLAESELSLGVVPFELKCVVESRENLQDVTRARWSFGDSGTAEGLVASHTYAEPGNYTVHVEVEGEHLTCGEDGWTSEVRKAGYVRACGIPEVEFGASHVDGRQYRTQNQTDVSVYGCIQDIVWNVFRGADSSGEPIEGMTVKAWEPILEFEEDGQYTVVANIGGVAGTGAAALTIDVREHSGAGRSCNTVGSPAGMGLLAFGLSLVVRRRL